MSAHLTLRSVFTPELSGAPLFALEKETVRAQAGDCSAKPLKFACCMQPLRVMVEVATAVKVATAVAPSYLLLWRRRTQAVRRAAAAAAPGSAVRSRL